MRGSSVETWISECRIWLRSSSDESLFGWWTALPLRSGSFCEVFFYLCFTFIHNFAAIRINYAFSAQPCVSLAAAHGHDITISSILSNSTSLLTILHSVNFTSALRLHLTKLPIKFKMSTPNANQALMIGGHA